MKMVVQAFLIYILYFCTSARYHDESSKDGSHVDIMVITIFRKSLGSMETYVYGIEVDTYPGML